jgi:hypothetical protein
MEGQFEGMAEIDDMTRIFDGGRGADLEEICQEKSILCYILIAACPQ